MCSLTISGGGLAYVKLKCTEEKRAGAGLIAGGWYQLIFSADLIRIIHPVDGEMLNQTDGPVIDGCLIITVKIQASAGSNNKVNGIETKYCRSLFLADVPLKEYNILINTGQYLRIRIFKILCDYQQS